MLDKLTLDVFAPHLKHAFLLYYTEIDFVETQLIEATGLSVANDEDDEEASELPVQRKPFSLIFRSDSKTEYLRQRIYTVKHEQLGAFDLFLVPIGPDKKGMRYQAIFS